MATLNAVIDRVIDTVHTATKIRCVELTDAPPAPCIMIYPDSPIVESDTWAAAFQRGVFAYDLVLECLLPSVAVRSSQRTLNEWLTPFGATSIYQAILSAPTLGTDTAEAVAGTPTMTASTPRPPNEWGFVTGVDGTRYLSCKAYVRVMTRGDL